MTADFRPTVTYDKTALRIVLRDPQHIAHRQELDVVIDLDEFGDPSGIEIIGLCSALGARAAERPPVFESGDVRFSYDRESDAAAIGVDVGSGTRIRSSVPKRALAELDEQGRLSTIVVKMQ